MSKEMPWRDIFPLQAWDQYIVQYQDGQKKFDPGFKGVKSLLNAFKLGKRSGHNEFLAALRKLVANYHNVPKDSVNTLTMRAALLEQIAMKAEGYLRNLGTDRGNADKSSMAYLLVKLARRARRKAEYIKVLKRYCDQKAKGFTGPRDLQNYLFRDRKRDDDMVALTSGVLLERLDPWHRSFELGISYDSGTGARNFGDTRASFLGLAFLGWMREAEQSDTPFFVWMEKHYVCTGVHDAHTEDLNAEEPKGSVAYQVEPALKQMVYMNSGLAYTSADEFQVPFSTIGVQRSKEKDCYAYVWTKCDLILVAPHVGGEFHHSSFTGGRKVKCAGMIGFDNGKVFRVSNDSGHYKPGSRYLKNFVRFLQGNHVFADNATIRDMSVKIGLSTGATYTLEAFLA